EYEIGVEIGSAAFLNNYSGSLAQVQSVVAGIPGNLDARFLHSTGIKFRLGTVIIRQSTGEDPFTVSNGNDSGGLSAFRSYWNNNPQEVGNTHDLAVYHVRGNPSGLAYVNNVGTSSRYLLSASNGPTSWADGTLAHEVGHQWNLNHVPSNPDSSFYESKPRSNGNAAGGSDQFVSIMHGSGTHNIGRVSTGEANRAFAARQNKLGFGDLVTNFGEVKPFGHLDEVSVVGESPIVIDVIANDYDVNNDVLNVQLRDTVSQQGATISLSVGTGPGGRDQIIYTPAAGQQTGTDFFHYNVVDSTGRSDWGAVYVDYQGATTVDLNQTVYRYDLGPENSVVFPAYELISDATFGDLGFTMPGNPGNFVVESRDRGAASGVNNLNRDHIRLRAEADFHHKLADGIYDVLFTVGDRLENSNPIILTAEGSVSLTTVNHGPADFTNYTLQDVTVTDGELNVDIVNQGFTSNITRIVITRVGDAPSVVDTGLTSYDYDFGTPTSPVPSGWVGITPDTYGDISWSGATPLRLDRGSIPGVNDINRDFVYGPGASTLNHKLADGVWRVVLNMGDASFAHDQMGVRAEGQLITNSVTSFAGQFLYVDENGGSATPTSFDVVVSDGELNLEFSDNGGIDANWVLNRLSLDRIGDVPAPASIVGRHIFYNNSSFDSNNPAANAQDDSAIATDKTALLPGQNAAFTNYTSYSNGINGVMIDVADLASASLSASDFVFKAGNNDDPSSWATAPTPTSITIRGGAGAGGSDRVTLVWPDSAIKNQWLEVTVKANSQTGLTQDDIFYFGNAIGETGNSTTGTVVNISDMLGVRSNPHNLGNPAGVADAYDFNRDRQVNISDMLIARSNATNLSNDLELITVPDQPLATASIASLEASPTSTIIQNYDALAALAYQQLMDQNNGTSIGEEDEDETQEEVLNPSEQLLDQPGI
nr:hypothetical protein [Phycisphaeraceae bacterium]